MDEPLLTAVGVGDVVDELARIDLSDQVTVDHPAPPDDIGRRSKLVSAVLGRAVDLTHLAALHASLPAGIRDVWFGYALTPATGAANPVNVLVFRGTQSIEEWLEDLAIAQIDVPLVWFSGGRFGGEYSQSACSTSSAAWRVPVTPSTHALPSAAVRARRNNEQDRGSLRRIRR